ncbi:MAG: hypothetical protein V3S31_00010 [Dehalococcoidia bacterium]
MVQTAARKVHAKNCIHHWMIETPNGRESRGVCKNCGRKRAFANSTENVMWEQTNTLRNELRSTLRIPRPTELKLADEN